MKLTAQRNMLSKSVLITQEGNFLSGIIDLIEEPLISGFASDKT